MRAYAKPLILLAIISAVGAVHAADTEDTLLVQSQTPAPPPPPQPFRLPPWQPTPRQPLFPLQPFQPPQPAQPRQAGPVPCVAYPMRMVPADPNVDPKMIVRRPPGAPPIDRMPEILSNRCRAGSAPAR